MSSKELAKKIRIHSLKMTSRSKSAHIGSALSIADILAVLYNDFLNVDPHNPRASNRDRFILSKGHAGVALYATLAEKGFFNPKLMETYYQNGSNFNGHVNKGIPGVEFSTGSLGHGLSVGTGIALGAKMDKKKYNTVVLLSDGECNEGSNWESILFAAHHSLDNLIAIVDYNKIQSLGLIQETISLEPFAEKWNSFGWHVEEVDGHNHYQLKNILADIPFEKNRPSVIIAHTIKGKGISFMENSIQWHYHYAQGEEFNAALKELEAGK